MVTSTLPPTVKERIPSESGRYNDKHAGYGKKRTIPIGPLDVLAGDSDATRPFGPVPVDWTELVHPSEGLPFFYNSKLRIITDVYIRIPRLLTQIEDWYAELVQVIRALDNTTNQLGSMDIYIEPVQDDPMSGHLGSCNYYLVDHARCTICFLREVQTSAIGLPDVRSTIHLERVLRGEYWTHCEYMPRPDVDMTWNATKLQGQLAALMIDNISSEGSTSPFTPEECKSYLKGLENANDSQFKNWSVARINSLLVQSQIVNLHGEASARLDRTVVVTGQHVSVRSSSYQQYSKIMFDGPAIHLTKLEHIWVERIIYTHHWRKLVIDLMEEWNGALAALGLVWISDAILFSTASSPLVISLLGASTACAIFGGIKALLLIRDHRAMGKYAAHGSQFLQSKEEYGTGLQRLSIEYSYPWACALWSGCLTTLAVLWVLASTLIGSLMSMVSTFGYAPTYVIATALLAVGTWAYGKGYNPRTLMFPNRLKLYRVR